MRCMTRLSCLLAACGLLAGCFGSSEPSANEILEAIRSNRAQREGALLSYPDSNIRWNNPASIERVAARVFQTAKVEKIGCVPAQGLPGVNCEYRLLLPLPNGGTDSNRHQKRFVKGERGWQILS